MQYCSVANLCLWKLCTTALRKPYNFSFLTQHFVLEANKLVPVLDVFAQGSLSVEVSSAHYLCCNSSESTWSKPLQY